MYSTETTVEIEYEAPDSEDVIYFDLGVEWEFSKYYPAQISGPVEACHPAEGGELETCIVRMPDGETVYEGETLLRSLMDESTYIDHEEHAFERAMDY